MYLQYYCLIEISASSKLSAEISLIVQKQWKLFELDELKI